MFGKTKTPTATSVDDRMTLTEHLGELRMRIIRCVLAVVIGFILIIAFYKGVLGFMTHPYRSLCDANPKLNCPDTSSRLVILGPIEGFTTRVTISTWGGIFLATPVILWQLWRFIVPGLHEHERRYAIPFLVSSVFLFILGATLAYLTLEPSIKWLIEFGGGVQQQFQVSKYIQFVSLMLAAFGVGLEFPLLLIFLQLVGVLKYQSLLKNWRYAVVGVMVIAALITPSGDPISNGVLAATMLILYFVAALVGRFVTKRREKKEAAAGE